MAELGSLVVEIGANVNGLTSALNSVQGQLAETKEKTKKWGEEFARVGKTMTIVGGAMTAALGLIVRSAANAGDEVAKLSQRTGVSTELLSGYRLAADLADVSLQGLGAGLKLLSRNMYDASLGIGEAKEAFVALGVSVVNSDGTLRDSNEVMLDVADKFSGMEDGAKKTALAMDIFGRSGADLIPMLNLGREGLQENYEQAERLGLVYSRDAAAAAEEFNDSLTTLKAALGGAGREIGEALIPTIQKLVEWATGVIAKFREWADAHPGLVSALTTLVGGAGALMTIAGPILLILPKLAAGFTLVKTAISNLNPIMAASTAAIGILIAKILEYKGILDDLKGQVEKNTQIDKNWSDAQERSSAVLAVASRLAGLHYGEMARLIDVYEGNTAALQSAIRDGKIEGITQEHLAKAAEIVNDRIAKQTGAFGGLTSTTQKLTPQIKGAADANKAFAEKIAPVATVVVNEVNPALSALEQKMFDLAHSDNYQETVDNVNSTLDAIAAKARETGDTIEDDQGETTANVSTFWEDLIRDITIGWADGLQGLVEGTKSFSDFLSDTWGAIKQTFFRLIADMLVKWLVGLIAPMVAGTTTAAATMSGAFAGVGASLAAVGTAIAGVITALIGVVATGIVTIATAIAGAIVALATGIAAAATALAAAAPALLTVGAVALVIYAGFAAIQSLIGSGNGGSGDGMGRVVERQDKFLAIWNWWAPQVAELLTALQELGTTLCEKIDNLAVVVMMVGNWLLKATTAWDGKIVNQVGLVGAAVKEWGKNIVNAVNAIEGYASGGVAWTPQLATVAESGPEIIIPLDEYRGGTGLAGIGSGGAGASTVHITQNIYAQNLDRATIDRSAEYLYAAMQRQMARRGM